MPGIFAAVPYCLDLIGAPYIETRSEVCRAFRPKSATAAPVVTPGEPVSATPPATSHEGSGDGNGDTPDTAFSHLEMPGLG